MADRLLSGRRYYDQCDVRMVLQPAFDAGRRNVVVYCRVSLPGKWMARPGRCRRCSSSAWLVGWPPMIVTSEVGGAIDVRRYEKELKGAALAVEDDR